jgi:hypothetical protein
VLSLPPLMPSGYRQRTSHETCTSQHRLRAIAIQRLPSISCHAAPVSGNDSFEVHGHLADLDYLTTSRAAAWSFAENYVGLPMG